MPFLGILLIIIQLLFAVHVIRTGRDNYWVYIILFVPMLGCAIYFLTQVLPEANSSRAAHKARSAIAKAIDPKKELRKRKELLQLSDTVDNRIKLAEECMEASFYQEAKDLFKSCLARVGEDDPHLLLSIARCEFALEDFSGAKLTLEELIAKNPEFKSNDGHMLYARTLEGLGLLEQAVAEYKVLSHTYAGEEGRVRYGLTLKRLGRETEADEVFERTFLTAKQSPKYYRKKEKEWITLAKNAYRQVDEVTAP